MFCHQQMITNDILVTDNFHMLHCFILLFRKKEHIKNHKYDRYLLFTFRFPISNIYLHFLHELNFPDKNLCVFARIMFRGKIQNPQDPSNIILAKINSFRWHQLLFVMELIFST